MNSSELNDLLVESRINNMTEFLPKCYGSREITACGYDFDCYAPFEIDECEKCLCCFYETGGLIHPEIGEAVHSYENAKKVYGEFAKDKIKISLD